MSPAHDQALPFSPGRTAIRPEFLLFSWFLTYTYSALPETVFLSVKNEAQTRAVTLKLKDLLEHRLLGPISRVSDEQIQGVALKLHFEQIPKQC